MSESRRLYSDRALQESRGLSDELERSERRGTGKNDESHRLWYHLQTHLNLDDSSPSKRRNLSSSERGTRNCQTFSRIDHQVLFKGTRPASSTPSSARSLSECSDDYFLGADLADGNGATVTMRRSSYEEDSSDLPRVEHSWSGGSLSRRPRSMDLLSYHC